MSDRPDDRLGSPGRGPWEPPREPAPHDLPGDESTPAFPDTLGETEADPSGGRLAVAAQAAGVVGTIIGLVPAFAFVGVPCGVVAIVLGIMGHDARPANATAGIVFGVIAVLVSVLGAGMV